MSKGIILIATAETWLVRSLEPVLESGGFRARYALQGAAAH